MKPNFFTTTRMHKDQIKDHPKRTLIIDSIFLFITLTALILINVLVIINQGFNPILILSWVLLGGICAWLIDSIIKCIKRLKEISKKKSE